MGARIRSVQADLYAARVTNARMPLELEGLAGMDAALDCLSRKDFDPVRHFQSLHLIMLVPLEHMDKVARFIDMTHDRRFQDTGEAYAQRLVDTCFRGVFDGREDQDALTRELHGILVRYIARRPEFPCV